jgi:predicted lipoprotein with Yx(FWY)xxD motif
VATSAAECPAVVPAMSPDGSPSLDTDAPISSRTMRRALFVWVSCVAVIVLASCSGPQATRPPGATPSNTPSYEVSTAQLKGLGTVLVDGGGYTLYLFVPDDHASHSTCSGICADEWPPLLLPTGVAAARPGKGVQAALLGTTVRADGSVQVTYAGWPLYTWPDDLSPGQATGQGLNNVGGLWYVVSPQGNPIRS